MVTRADVQAAVDELRWVEYAARPHQHHGAGAVRLGNAAAAAGGAAGAGAGVAGGAASAVVDNAAAYGRLLVATEGRTVREIPLRNGRLIVGRTPDNDVQIDSRFVSRHHCQVITTAHSCVIEDLNSTNGIFVKSARVRRHYLNDGDVVLVGKHELIYVDERAPRSRAGHTDSIPAVQAAAEEDLPESQPDEGAAPAR
jgi:hypothetical protein